MSGQYESDKQSWTDKEFEDLKMSFLRLLVENKELKAELAALKEAKS